MRIFLDVGAHDGQTLEEVIDPNYGFDEIYAFEPMPDQFAHLTERYGNLPNVTLCKYGLAGKTCGMPLYGSNEYMEASIYPAKIGVDADVVTAGWFREAADFVAELPEDAELTVKLNCEGAEVDILDNLIDTGTIWHVEDMLIDFDIRKVAGMEHREAEVIDRMHTIGFTRFTTYWPHGPTHQARIRNWLQR